MNKMNKQGQVFTLITLVLIGLIFITFEIFSIAQERESVKTRVSSMENTLFSIEENLERQMYISGFRIIFLAEEQITNTGQYINVNQFFNEAFFNGSVSNTNATIMEGVKYPDIIASINQKAAKTNVVITFSNSSIQVSQINPWNVRFTLVTNFIMEDKSNLARWNKQQIISADIPISEFDDPLYIVNTNALISRKINQTIYPGIYTNGIDTSNLLAHFNKKYYAANSLAPSFLNRLSGNFSADINGIESFVDLTQLSQQGISTKDKSCIDYIYFSENNPTSFNIQGMPSWFKIDSAHLSFYNVSSLTL